MIPGHDHLDEDARAEILHDLALDRVHARGEYNGETPCGLPMRHPRLQLAAWREEITCPHCLALTAAEDALRSMRASANEVTQ